MELKRDGTGPVLEEDWLKGHQRPWIFERILLVASNQFAGQIKPEFERNLYTLECVKNSAEALRRIIQSEFEVVLCELSRDFPAEMFYRGVERVRPYLVKRLLFFVNSQTEPEVIAFVRKMKIGTIWYPGESYVMFETITGVVRKTTSLAGFAAASEVKILGMFKREE